MSKQMCDKSTQTERHSPKISIVSRIQQIIDKADKDDTSGFIILAHGNKDSPLMKKISSRAKQLEDENGILQGCDR